MGFAMRGSGFPVLHARHAPVPPGTEIEVEVESRLGVFPSSGGYSTCRGSPHRREHRTSGSGAISSLLLGFMMPPLS